MTVYNSESVMDKDLKIIIPAKESIGLPDMFV